MTPRPRKKCNTGLPPNLYKNGKYYSYKHPATGVMHGMGKSAGDAIEAAKVLNSRLMQDNCLVSGVMGSICPINNFCQIYLDEILPQYDYAENTVKLYQEKVRHIMSYFGNREVSELTVKDISGFLERYPARSSNQHRQIFIQIFKQAMAKGYVSENVPEFTLSMIEKKQRERLTKKQFDAISQIAPDWLQNAMDIALITLQRREDITLMKWESIKDGSLFVIQGKTQKHDAAYLKIKISGELQQVLNRCRDNLHSPFIIHRNPIHRVKREGMHWTQVSPPMLTREFKKCCDQLGIKNTSFHEIRALGIKLYKDRGIDPQALAGHSSAKMTKNYDAGHNDIRWVEVDL